MNFQEMQVNATFIKALEKQKITTPTQVQASVYGEIVAHKDIIVQSETGSGKTLAYLVPVFEKYNALEKTNQVIILVPTHELAMQVHKQIQTLATNAGIDMKSMTIFANVNIERQIEYLKQKPQIIVGTSGRILELIKRKKISAHTVKTVIVDEADKLLDKNNLESIQAVIKCTLRDRQLLFFSASMPAKIVTIAAGMSKDAKVIKPASTQTIPSDILHMYIVVERREKIETLRKLVVIQKAKKAMVFVNGKFDIEEATEKLKYHKFLAECIHGSVEKKDRQKVIEGFKNNKISYLVATDIAARGLHFEGVDTVFHISIPEDPMDYLHRAGRTGRNGLKGTSILIVTKEELPRLKAFQKAFGINLLPKKMFKGKLVKA